MKITLNGVPMTVNKRTRRVSPTSNLGGVQNPILAWLLAREEEITATGTEQEKLVLEARGVPWNVKQFCKGCEKACKKGGSPDSSKISTSLERLEVKRRLVTRYGIRTSHVKLTDEGRTQALAKRADPRTWQEKEVINHSRYLAGHISNELHRHGDQMSSATQHIEFARLAYHLLTLEERGELQSWQKQELTLALRLLQGASFEQLPMIAQEPDLEKHHAAEIEGLYEKLQSEMFTST